MAGRRNRDGQGLSLVAEVLREARHKAGLSSDELGAKLAARPHVTSDEVENLVAARLARQEILDSEDAPLIYAVLDEAALHRQVGGAEVMRDQLEHLVALSRRPAITVQVIPFTLGA